MQGGACVSYHKKYVRLYEGLLSGDNQEFEQALSARGKRKSLDVRAQRRMARTRCVIRGASAPNLRIFPLMAVIKGSISVLFVLNSHIMLHFAGKMPFNQRFPNNHKTNTKLRHGYFPGGTVHISKIENQLGILLPPDKNVRSILPVLITSYICKYRKNMDESTLEFISRLIDRGNKAEVQVPIKRKLGCFYLSPLSGYMPKITYEKIELANEAVLRRYHISLMFSHLLIHFKEVCNLSLSIRLYNEVSEDLKIFLSPGEYEKVGLYSYDFDALLNDAYKNEINEVFGIRMPPIEPNIELDFITGRFKRLILDHDDNKNAEELFDDSLNFMERVFRFF